VARVHRIDNGSLIVDKLSMEARVVVIDKIELLAENTMVGLKLFGV
jgi:hypothetical protein